METTHDYPTTKQLIKHAEIKHNGHILRYEFKKDELEEFVLTICLEYEHKIKDAITDYITAFPNTPIVIAQFPETGLKK